MRVKKQLVRDHDKLSASFLEIMDGEVNPTSRNFSSSYAYLNFTPLLSLALCRNIHFSGIWAAKSICVLIPIQYEAFYHDGIEMKTDKNSLEFAMLMPGLEHDFSFNSESEILGLLIEPSRFISMFETLMNLSFEPSLTGLMRFKSPEHKLCFLNLVLPFAQLRVGKTPVSAEQANLFAIRIVEVLVGGIDYGREVSYLRSYCRFLAMRAHELLIASPQTSLTMSDVCLHLDASARSIQQGFSELYGRGLIEYHRNYRMAKVRKHLQQYGARNIGKVIQQFGFNHSGNFSAGYKKVYGIAPSKDVYK